MRRTEVTELLCDSGAVSNSELRLCAVPLWGEGHTPGRLGAPRADTSKRLRPSLPAPLPAPLPERVPTPRPHSRGSAQYLGPPSVPRSQSGCPRRGPTPGAVPSTLALHECGMAADALLLLLWPGRYLYMVGVGGLSFPNRLLSAGEGPRATTLEAAPLTWLQLLKVQGR